MTAKEIAEDCKFQISKEDFRYVFHPNKFNKFCKQLCKEKAQKCAINLITRSEFKIYPKDYIWFKNIINNALNPEFE